MEKEEKKNERERKIERHRESKRRGGEERDGEQEFPLEIFLEVKLHFIKTCVFLMLAFIQIFIKMNMLERKKLNFRSFTVCQFQSFFVRCRRTYVLNN